MDARDWNDRYSGSELVWGAEPNRFVAELLGEAPPGRVLDVACGEGRNAIWLASRGWRATGVDFSGVAIERARRLASEARLEGSVEFVQGDVVAGPLPGDAYDAVVVAYVHVPAAARREVVRKAAGVVGEGGRLLVVGHDMTNLSDGVGGPRDPEVLFSPDDVVGDLAGVPALVVERAQRVRRAVQTPEGPREAIDALVVFRRAA